MWRAQSVNFISHDKSLKGLTAMVLCKQYVDQIDTDVRSTKTYHGMKSAIASLPLLVIKYVQQAPKAIET